MLVYMIPTTLPGDRCRKQNHWSQACQIFDETCCSAPELALSPHTLRLSLVHPEHMDFQDALGAITAGSPEYVKGRLKRFLKGRARLPPD
jgi:hypothetical protein